MGRTVTTRRVAALTPVPFFYTPLEAPGRV